MSKDFENNNGNKEPNSFGLPEDYFNSSAGSIFNKIEWIEEHKQYEKLSTLKKESGFVTPENYFETKESDLELISYPNLLAHKKEHGFTIPENYFEELEVIELSKVLLENENELSGFNTLNSIEKKSSFIVSENYFETSSEKIISEIKQGAIKSAESVAKKGEAKVIRLFSPKLWYSAAAAVFAITLGIWIYNQYFTPVADGDCGTLACIDRKDIIKAQIESLDEDQLFQTVDAKKLEENLNNKSKESDKKDIDSSNTEDILDEI